MPIHDWTRVNAGTWHDFHLAWIAEIRNTLNGGLLPPSYYAQAEQIAGPMGPDVLTLQMPEMTPEFDTPEAPGGGGLAVATAPPRAWLVDEAEMNEYVLKRRTLVIRHISGDRIVALIELVSPGNKAARFALRSFVDKAVESLYRGYHLLIVDLFPPGPRDPQGIHGAVWAELSDRPFALPPDRPLTLAAYSAGQVKRRLRRADGRRPRAGRDAALPGVRDVRQRAPRRDLPGGLPGSSPAVEAGAGGWTGDVGRRR